MPEPYRWGVSADVSWRTLVELRLEPIGAGAFPTKEPRSDDLAYRNYETGVKGLRDM
jgi:hypothetical protein